MFPPTTQNTLNIEPMTEATERGRDIKIAYTVTDQPKAKPGTPHLTTIDRENRSSSLYAKEKYKR